MHPLHSVLAMHSIYMCATGLLNLYTARSAVISENRDAFTTFVIDSEGITCTLQFSNSFNLVIYLSFTLYVIHLNKLYDMLVHACWMLLKWL